jgi:phage terminase large subunit
MPDIKLTKKQSIAWDYLNDVDTKEILFGSGAGSGKSFLGCLWVSTMCITYPGVRYLIGRAVLTQLRLTTLRTLLETFKTMNLEPDKHYTYNQQTNIVSFYNGSEIILKDMASTPSDPMFDSLGSLEITGAFLDEMTQISQMAYHIIKTRIRFKLDQYNITGKLFMSCNPHQGYLKREFYVPFIEERLEPIKKFVMATAMDNPNLPKQYIDTLNALPTLQRERLLLGNWNYTNDINAIFDFDLISQSIFKFKPNDLDKKYATLDISRFGEDRSVLMIWVGLCLVECKIYRKLPSNELIDEVKSIINSHKIHPNNVIADADGVGGPVSDMLKATNFVNNSRALHDQNFTNLKSQSYVKLSELFKEGKISINLLDTIMVDELTQELLAIKLKDIDKDSKIGVQSKDDMKKILGKSPDLSDAMMMRMLPEIKSLKSTGRYAISTIGR